MVNQTNHEHTVSVPAAFRNSAAWVKVSPASGGAENFWWRIVRDVWRWRECIASYFRALGWPPIRAHRARAASSPRSSDIPENARLFGKGTVSLRVIGSRGSNIRDCAGQAVRTGGIQGAFRPGGYRDGALDQEVVRSRPFAEELAKLEKAADYPCVAVTSVRQVAD